MTCCVQKMSLDEYEERHEAMMLLWDAYDEADERLQGRIRRAINYLRDCAFESVPWSGDVKPNKTYRKHQFGRLVGWAG